MHVLAVSRCLKYLKPCGSLLHYALKTPSCLKACTRKPAASKPLTMCFLSGCSSHHLTCLLFRKAFSPLLSVCWQWGNQHQTQQHFVESGSREAASASAGGTALQRVVIVPSCHAGVRFRVPEGLAEGCGSSECLAGSMGDRWESVRSREIWIIG